MNRTDVGLMIVAALAIAGIVVGVVFPIDDGTAAELEEARRALEGAQAELAERDTELVEVRAELADAEAALAASPPPPPPIHREAGHWSYGEKISADVGSIEYWGTELSGLESTLMIEAEGEFGLLEPVPTLTIICYADGSRRTWIEGITLEPNWNEERERHEYEIAYRVSPTPELLPDGERSGQWWAGQEYDFTDRWQTYPTLEGLLYVQLKGSDELEIALVGLDGERLDLTFVAAGAFETRIQPNLDRCGNYY